MTARRARTSARLRPRSSRCWRRPPTRCTGPPTEAAAKIQEVAEKAIVTAKEAARDAAASVESAIGDANEKMLEVTQTTITQTVGAKEAEFYDLGSLRDKMRNRPV